MVVCKLAGLVMVNAAGPLILDQRRVAIVPSESVAVALSETAFTGKVIV